ncbi:MAG: YeeE/YedE family protein [Rhodospirillales bacterium]|nr:YeeE/YedE family protein [Rhodospirillales bacterium]
MTAIEGERNDLGSPAAKPPSRRKVSVLALALIVAGAAVLQQNVGGRQALLFLIGCSFGFVLFGTSFSFTRAWRRLVAEQRGSDFRAQILMLAIASLFILPLAHHGSVLGRPVVGAIAPLGVSVVVGGFLFGAGMQLAGACASGLLYSIGGGSARMLVVLVCFVIGSLLGTWHLPWWLSLPRVQAVGVVSSLGLPWGIATQLALLSTLAVATALVERRAHGSVEPVARMLLLGAVALAFGNALTLIVAGHPWTTTFAFALWGAKLGNAAGWPIADWTFWTWPYPARALAASVLFDVTSVMNVGIVAGAFLAAGMSGRFARQVSVRAGAYAAAALGGLAMGYGARLGFGCNIGAYFSGIASGSLHGWLWMLAALAGTAAGLALRPRFGFMDTRTVATPATG